MTKKHSYRPHTLVPIDVGRESQSRQIVNRESPLLTIEEMGRLFRVSTRTIQRWSENRLIPFVRIGRTVRYDIRDVYDHLDENGVLDTVSHL